MRSERVITIETPCRLSIDNARLRITKEGQYQHVALIDIGSVILDTPMIELTSAVLRDLAENDVALIATDAKHYPCSMIFPQREHTFTVRRQRLQASMSSAVADVFWARTVAAKLRNQARFLSAEGKATSLARLERMANAVPPGDPENFEAQGAKLYWGELFAGSFKRAKRGAEDPRNSALNFGYAVLRGLIARYLSVAGLSPVFGFGHKNEGNAYCLVDDLIEPFRPAVDALVVTSIDQEQPFDSASKKAMLKLLDAEAQIGERVFRLHAAINETIASYVRALESGREEQLDFPRGFTLAL